ncbi:MAG: MalY/PatB family protein [Actinomycetota bacterium]
MSDSEFDNLKLEELNRLHSAKWRHYPRDVIAAWVAEMDFPAADPVRRAVIAAAERSDFGYPASIEHTGFGQVVAGWADRSYGWKVDPGSVLLLPDVVRALQVGLLVSTEPTDGVVIQPPVYPPFFSVVRDNGRRLVENPMVFREGRYEIDLEGLDAAMSDAQAFILCNPQNPTGRSFGREELEAMAELAIRHDVLVIADEVHSPLTLPGSTHTVFAMLGDEVAERTITVTAASKAWNFGGLKCGFAVAGSQEVTAKLKSLGHHATGSASILGIEATEAAFTAGEPWIDRVVTYLDGNRRLLADLLEEHLPEVVYAMPEATYLAWLDCRALNLKPDPHTFFLEEARVAFSAGPHFGTQGEGFVRFNFATSKAIVTEMVERMAAAVRRSREA